MAIKKLKTYICPFCETEQPNYNRTQIKYQGKWYLGCQDCFMRSIDEKKMIAFQRRNYKLLSNYG